MVAPDDESPSPAEAVSPRVLVLSRPDELSAVVLASSVLAPVREALPKAKIYLLVRSEYAELFCEHPLLDGLILWDGNADSAEALAAQLEAVHADSLAHLSYSGTVEKAAKLAKIRNVAAFEFSAKNDTESGDGVTLEILPTERHREIHEAFFNFEILSAFGVPEPAKPEMNLCPDPAKKQTARAKLAEYGIAGADYAVFCLDANGQGHSVDSAVFSGAAAWLRAHAEMPIVVLGEKTVAGTARFLRFCRLAFGMHILDLRGQASPAEGAWILSEARFCLSGECACAYLASAVRCPLAALFVDFSSGRWFPLGHLTTNIFTGAQRLPLEPISFFTRRASRAFRGEKIASALQFVLALREA